MESKTMMESKIKEVNKILLDGEPGNITEDSYSGFKATGYKPQYVIDSMNKVFGIDDWGFEVISNEIGGKDQEMEAVCSIKVFIRTVRRLENGNTGYKRADRTAYGGKKIQWRKTGEKVTDFADAKKSAQTDALKKALSYFSIGNRAYHGKLKLNNSYNGNKY